MRLFLFPLSRESTFNAHWFGTGSILFLGTSSVRSFISSMIILPQKMGIYNKLQEPNKYKVYIYRKTRRIIKRINCNFCFLNRSRKLFVQMIIIIIRNAIIAINEFRLMSVNTCICRDICLCAQILNKLL